MHRDIKPANILIGQALEGKLSDFGLAIPAGLNLKALGIKEYAYVLHLAPELYSGQQHSISSDLYACGVTLYRLVNGDAFFVSPPPDELEDLVLEGEFPKRDAYRDFIPLSLRRLINKAISVDPSDRFASAAEMRRALERLSIGKNWVERKLANGTEWRCGWNKKCYEVQRLCGADNKWSVSVRKGSSKSSLRRISALCAEGLSEEKAKQRSRRTLQDFCFGQTQMSRFIAMVPRGCSTTPLLAFVRRHKRESSNSLNVTCCFEASSPPRYGYNGLDAS